MDKETKRVLNIGNLMKEGELAYKSKEGMFSLSIPKKSYKDFCVVLNMILQECELIQEVKK